MSNHDEESPSRKLRMRARKLVDGTVNNVSLVTHGANRIPFRQIKSESSAMKPFGLDTVFLSKTAVQPTLAGLIVRKSKIEGATELLKAADLPLHGVEEGEVGAFMKMGEDAALEEGVVIRLNDDVAAVMHNMKSFVPWEVGEDFEEIMKAGGFYSGISDACYAMQESLGKMLMKEEVKAPPVDAAVELIDRFKEHVVSLVQNLPMSAFKVAQEIADLTVTEEKADDDKATEGETATEAKSDDTAAAAEGEAEGETVTEGKQESTEAEGDTPASEDAGASEDVTAAKQDSESADLVALVTSLTTKVDEAVKSMEGVTAKFDESVTEVRAIAEDARNRSLKAEEAITGTIATGDMPESVRGQKSEQGGVASFEAGLFGSEKSDGPTQVHVENW